MGVTDVADELALGVDEVRGAVEVVVAEVLDANSVDGADEVFVRDRGGRLFEFPEVRREPTRGGRRVEHDLRTVQTEGAPAFGEMPVVADVDADLADGGVEDREPEVAGAEVELLPETVDVRDVVLAVLAEILPVSVDDSCRVVEDAGLLLLVHRQDHDHAELGGQCLKPLGGRRSNKHDIAVELRVLHLAEVGAVEEFLEADGLRALGGGLAGVVLVGQDHRLLVARPGGLHQRRANRRHRSLQSHHVSFGAACHSELHGQAGAGQAGAGQACARAMPARSSRAACAAGNMAASPRPSTRACTNRGTSLMGNRNVLEQRSPCQRLSTTTSDSVCQASRNDLDSPRWSAKTSPRAGKATTSACSMR